MSTNNYFSQHFQCHACPSECTSRYLEDLLCLKKTEINRKELNRHKEKREIANRRTFDDVTEAMMVAEIQDALSAGHPYEQCTFEKWVSNTNNKDISRGFKQSFRDRQWRDVKLCIVKP
ncbi:MAG: hypothetical protein EZS28_010812 [Streblomastix strix]|uniref:Uncharacterized protein n=1 Tax=Streblomastix strix TaxID=222440 RepID=A0A5J4WFK3_9EUKA|nr:MAG: hypothetical protein EZS28_010812 [Streblomastix strix]